MATLHPPKQASHPLPMPTGIYPRSDRDKQLDDWNTYYQLLLTGKLNQYGGKFIVVHEGNVVAHGCDPDELRGHASKLLGIAGANLVIPFVDDKECLIAE
jgi:hypothetical protein